MPDVLQTIMVSDYRDVDNLMAMVETTTGHMTSNKTSNDNASSDSILKKEDRAQWGLDAHDA